ncbi:hypothetical protein F2Q68_00026232 [Brassica cretica]|uniref:Uncharacterized protein n=1 Tax=Brassica cretica TaxID=69181 RepID=A0A8S9IG94_BRACR|nr:hypothetical protein F2Q68_00026232 [Brassica cretica]
MTAAKISETNVEGFQGSLLGSLLTFNALEDFQEVFLKSSRKSSRKSSGRLLAKFFITWFSSSTHLKIYQFFRSETDLEEFQGSLLGIFLTFSALHDFMEVFWKPSPKVFSHVKWSLILSLWRNEL